MDTSWGPADMDARVSMGESKEAEHGHGRTMRTEGAPAPESISPSEERSGDEWNTKATTSSIKLEV